MRRPGSSAERVFKTAWFAKASAKALISDSELCVAIRQVMLGQCDDLGGGVYKKRLGKNLYRSIVVAKGGNYWVYAHLFAKKNRANIDAEELSGFRDYAKLFAQKTEAQIRSDLQSKELMEICYDGRSQVQERSV